jgi:uncharacterized iron-regulated membrane protein
MKRDLYATNLIAGCVITLLCTGGGPAVAAPARPPREALTVDEALACIRTAAAAQAGWVKEVEGDDDGGTRLCEVQMVDEAGKRHTVHVDVQTNQVVKTK